MNLKWHRNAKLRITIIVHHQSAIHWHGTVASYALLETQTINIAKRHIRPTLKASD